MADRQIGITWDKTSCAERLKDVRATSAKKMNGAKIARATGLTYSKVQDCFTGMFVPKDSDVALIAASLGVAPEALRCLRHGTRRECANAVARLLAQSGWLFGLESSSVEDRCVISVRDSFLASAVGEWAEVLKKSPKGSVAYRRWLYSFTDPLGQGGWRDEPRGDWSLAADRLRDRSDWREAHGPSAKRDMKEVTRSWYATSLRRRRESLGLSREDVAKRLGIGAPTLVMYESGYRLPRESRHRAIARVLGVQPDSLVVLDIASPLQLFFVMCDMLPRVGIVPSTDGVPHLEAKWASGRRVIDWWYDAWFNLTHTRPDAYLEWYETYNDSDPARRIRD